MKHESKYEEPHWITKKGQSKEKEAEEEKRKGHPHPFTYSRIGFSLFLFLFVNVLFVYFFLSFNSFHQVFTEHLYMPASTCNRLLRTNRIMFGEWFTPSSLLPSYLLFCIFKLGITLYQFLSVWVLWMNRKGIACWQCFNTKKLFPEASSFLPLESHILAHSKTQGRGVPGRWFNLK